MNEGNGPLGHLDWTMAPVDAAHLRKLSDSSIAQDQNADSAPSSNLATSSKYKTISCTLCRKRKLKCDRVKPSCGTCTRLRHDCIFPTARMKTTSKRRNVKDLEARLGMLFGILDSRQCAQLVFFQSVTKRRMGNCTWPLKPSLSSISSRTEPSFPWNSKLSASANATSSIQICPWLSGKVEPCRLARSLMLSGDGRRYACRPNDWPRSRSHARELYRSALGGGRGRRARGPWSWEVRADLSSNPKDGQDAGWGNLELGLPHATSLALGPNYRPSSRTSPRRHGQLLGGQRPRARGRGAPVPEISIWGLVSGAPVLDPSSFSVGRIHSPPGIWRQIPAASRLGSCGSIVYHGIPDVLPLGEEGL